MLPTILEKFLEDSIPSLIWMEEVFILKRVWNQPFFQLFFVKSAPNEYLRKFILGDMKPLS